MPPDTEEPAGRGAHTFGAFGAIVAGNVAAYRKFYRLKQGELAEGMRTFGHPTWTQSVVSLVERGVRQVTVDELMGLAMCLGLPPYGLLDPGAVPTAPDQDIDDGHGRRMSYPIVRAWVAGKVVFHYWPPAYNVPGYVRVSKPAPDTSPSYDEVLEELERRREVLGHEARPKEAIR